MSGQGGGILLLDAKDPKTPRNQIDVVAMDDEVALVIECKSTTAPRRLPDFAEDLAKHAASRDLFIRSLKAQFPTAHKRQVKFAFFTNNVLLSERDHARSADSSVAIFSQDDLDYYEALVQQVGSAARFQFLADLLPEHRIAGLEITVPTVRARIGGSTCYSFSVSPEYLLKISYVSHRAKGKPSDVDTYQRMLKKGRLTKIREYISNDGIFPTNIVVNIEPRYLTFQRARQEEKADEKSTFGWLQIRPAYKAAWIIDGQHRLYAYAGHDRAAKSVVTVLAFAGLDPSQQARLFIDINAEQRKVKQSLLQELYAELHWNADDPEIRIRAILSKAVQVLDTQPDSPLRGRILKADEARTDSRCISLTSIFNALVKTELFIAKVKRGEVVAFGPLWASETTLTLKRTVKFLIGWFAVIRQEAPALWDLGSAQGGGLAMNDGITVCINVLRSVVLHLQTRGLQLGDLDDNELVNAVAPFGVTVGKYFASMTPQQMIEFRALRGVQGQTAGTRHCQSAIRTQFPDFDPPGLAEFLIEERTETSQQAYAVIAEIERLLQTTVLEELKREFGPDENGWWHMGVPQPVRKKVALRIEDEGSIREKGAHLDLIDYRDIIVKNWNLFGDLFAREPKGNKEARTKWLVDLNDVRKLVMHASKGMHMPVTLEQLAFVEDLRDWLIRQVEGRGT